MSWWWAPNRVVEVGGFLRCDYEPTIDRYSLDGTLQSRVFLGGDGVWLTDVATADGRLALMGLSFGGGVASLALVDDAGSRTALPTQDFASLNVSQVPGGPVYAAQTTYDGTAYITRLAGAGVPAMSIAVSCPAWRQGARVLPGTGSAYAVVCRATSDVGLVDVSVAYQGGSSWSRTISGQLFSVTSGFVTADGRAVIAGLACLQAGCAQDSSYSSSFLRFGAAGAIDGTSFSDSRGPNQSIPTGTDSLAWTGSFCCYSGQGGWVDLNAASFGQVATNAGPDQTVNTGATVQLEGTATATGASSPARYQWTQLSGPAVTLTDPRALRPTFKAPSTAGQKVVLRLTTTGADGRVATDDVTITTKAPK